MEHKLIEDLIKMLDSSSINEIEIEEEGTYIRLVKNNEAPVIKQVAPVPMQAQKPAEEVVVDDLEYVRAPLVGTYYSKPSPDKPDFVSVGDEVKAGDVLCIIESMKVMNEITAPIDGFVKVISAQNGHLVEFDQQMIGIKSL